MCIFTHIISRNKTWIGEGEFKKPMSGAEYHDANNDKNLQNFKIDKNLYFYNLNYFWDTHKKTRIWYFLLVFLLLVFLASLSLTVFLIGQGLTLNGCSATIKVQNFIFFYQLQIYLILDFSSANRKHLRTRFFHFFILFRHPVHLTFFGHPAHLFFWDTLHI